MKKKFKQLKINSKDQLKGEVFKYGRELLARAIYLMISKIFDVYVCPIYKTGVELGYCSVKILSTLRMEFCGLLQSGLNG